MFAVNIVQRIDENALNKFLNAPLFLSLMAKFLGRYAQLNRIWKNSSGVHALVKPLGSKEAIEVVVRNIFLDDNGTKITLSGISSDMPWCQNLLADFVEGKPFKLSKNVAPILMLLQSILKQ